MENQHSGTILGNNSGFVKTTPSLFSSHNEVSSYYTRIKRCLKSHESEVRKISIQKKCCQSTWCQDCFKRMGGRKIIDRLRSMDWKRVRQVVLTVDRETFRTGQEALESIRDTKAIPNMIWNLKRVKGLGVIDWLWVIEWHEDGFPHFHLFIEVEKEGEGGMIGGDVIRKYWGRAKWVKESFIESEEHWKSVVGYFQKHGYFGKGKGHQTELPEWAKVYGKKIKRYGAMVLPLVDEEKKVVSGMGFSKKRGKRRAYGIILNECGKQSRVKVQGEILSFEVDLTVDYWKFRKALRGNYVKGVGFVSEVTIDDLNEIEKVVPGVWVLVDEILRREGDFMDYWGYGKWEDELEEKKQGELFEGVGI